MNTWSKTNEMSKAPQFHLLFNRLLDNSITEEELDELLQIILKTEMEDQVKSMLDEYWEKIANQASTVRPDAQSNERFTRIISNPGITGKYKNVKSIEEIDSSSKYGWWIGIAAAALLLIIAGIWGVFDSSISNESTLLETGIAFDGKQIVHLPDGSTVIMNEGSRLSYQENFGEERREISFSGEGYFEIQSDPSRPFIVHTGQVNTTVLGTAFNLVAYEDRAEVLVAVERGEVTVGAGDHIYDHIFPEEQLVVNTNTMRYEKEKADLERILAWKHDFLILDNVSIDDAASQIGAVFGVDIHIENSDMKKCLINAAFLHNESLEQVLRVLCGVLQAEYAIDNNIVNIIGGRSCN